MQISIKVSGLEKALEVLRKAETELQEPIKDTLKGGAQLIRGEAIKSIQSGSKTGRTYKRYNPTRTHRASAPGEAPASDTGNLVSNIMVQQKGDSIEVQSNAEYSYTMLPGPLEHSGLMGPLGHPGRRGPPGH